MTASNAWPSFYLRMETQVNNQVAAPAETRTPNLHRANEIAHEECGWKDGDSGNSATRKNMFNQKTIEPT